MSNTTASDAAAIRFNSAMSVTWKILREKVLLLGWGRAILLQLAHPLVAAGVSEHSTFLGPGERLRRLRRTVDAMLALTFGEPLEAAQAAGAINAIHDRVHGRLAEGTGNFPAGTPYSAHDPELLRWVHATLVDSFVKTYELLVGSLTDQEKNRYCAESAGMEPIFGVPAGYLPTNMKQLDLYMTSMFEGGQISVGRTARHLSREVLYPPFPRLVGPLLSLFRLLTMGMLPDGIRDAYDFQWHQRKERKFRRVANCLRHALPAIPPVCRYWRNYRTATRRYLKQEEFRGRASQPLAAARAKKSFLKRGKASM
jgi:uncharacterized protein (DUF2236 family)